MNGGGNHSAAQSPAPQSVPVSSAAHQSPSSDHPESREQIKNESNPPPCHSSLLMSRSYLPFLSFATLGSASFSLISKARWCTSATNHICCFPLCVLISEDH